MTIGRTLLFVPADRPDRVANARQAIAEQLHRVSDALDDDEAVPP